MGATTAQALGGAECLKCSICCRWFLGPDPLGAGPACSAEAEVWAGNVNKPLWSIKDLRVCSTSTRLVCRWALSAKWPDEEPNGRGFC